jgi:hypothetical protein
MVPPGTMLDEPLEFVTTKSGPLLQALEKVFGVFFKLKF